MTKESWGPENWLPPIEEEHMAEALKENEDLHMAFQDLMPFTEREEKAYDLGLALYREAYKKKLEKPVKEWSLVRALKALEVNLEEDEGCEDPDFWEVYFAKTQDPAVLVNALRESIDVEMPAREWLYLEIKKIIEEKREKPLGRGKHSFSQIDKQHQEDISRYATVKRLRKSGVKWEAVYQAASDELADTIDAGSDESIKRSYIRFKKWLKSIDPKARGFWTYLLGPQN